MPDLQTAQPIVHPARMKLEPYTAEIRLAKLTVGLDNIHYDVFLSPRFVEFTRTYILNMIRQAVNFSLAYDKHRAPTQPEHSAFRKLLTEILQESLTRAKFNQNLETDILHRLALLKFITQELSAQFASLLLECKDKIRARGEVFEHSEQAHVLRARISEIQADRKKIVRQVGDSLCRIWREVEENTMSKARRALIGEEMADVFDILQNRFLFVEGGNDEYLFLEHYVLLGNFINDPDRFEGFESLLIDFVSDFILADDNGDELSKARKAYDRVLEQARQLHSELTRIEEEQHELASRMGDKNDTFPRIFQRRSPAEGHSELEELRAKSAALAKSLDELSPHIDAAKQRVNFLVDENQSRAGDYLSEPANAQRIFDPTYNGGDASSETRARLLEEWVHRLEERDLLFHVLASYELASIYTEYCPPIHLQQLKKAIVYREEAQRVEQILEQFPARKISMRRLEEASRSIRRRTHEETLKIGLQFAEDLMRLRRDRRNYQQVIAGMDRINLVRSEKSRELSRENKSLYEFLHPEENRPTEDPIINHVVIKADVRGSTSITKDLLSRGLNPASHFSLNLHEPVKRMLERYAAAKVFIEGDAIILAIYENESTRATQRAVARACVLAREIIAVSAAYNSRASAAGLPPLELGVGVAFQDSAPSLWMDGDSRIMISKALNLSDRLSSCSKMARRLFKANSGPFRLYLLQTMMQGSDAEEGEELLVRYNLNGIELNEEGFQKLNAEISMAPMVGTFPMPWGKERVQLFFGEVPLGESFEPIIIRKGVVRQLAPDGTIGPEGTRPYYEICFDEKLLEVARKKLSALPSKN